MASKVIINGQQTNNPGVYSERNDAALSSVDIPLGVVGVVFDLPTLEQHEVSQVNSGDALAALDPTNRNLADVAKFLYDGSKDNRIQSGPNYIKVISPRDVDQASRTLNDAGANPQVTLSARAWGARGNMISVAVSANADDATLRDMVLTFLGETRTYRRLGSGGAIGFYYTGSVFDSMNLSYDGANLLLAGQIAAQVGGALVPTEAVFNDQITVTPSAAPGMGNTHTYQVQGTDDAGAAVNETLTWTDMDAAAKTTAATLVEVTTLTWTPNAAETAQVDCNCFDMDVTEYAFATDFVNNVNRYSTTQKYYATQDWPRAGQVPSDELDDLSPVDCAGAGVAAKKQVRADNWAVREQLSGDSWVEVADAVVAGTRAQIAALTASALVGGNNNTTPATSDYEDALAVLAEEENDDVSYLYVHSSDADVHEAVRAHTVAAQASMRRFAFLGGASQQTKATVKTATALLNSRSISYLVQDIYCNGSDSRDRWYAPMYFAAKACGMAAGAPVGRALTKTYANVKNVRGGSDWDPATDGGELTDAGLLFVVPDRFGFRFRRDVTTYQTDDNAARVERSTNESVDTSIDDIRQNLDVLIGQPGFTGTRASIARIVQSRLEYQKTGLRWIKDYLKSSIIVIDLGDTWQVNYTVAGLEPINFIVMKPTVDRIPETI